MRRNHLAASNIAAVAIFLLAAFVIFRLSHHSISRIGDITPFRPEVVALLSVKTWASLEMLLAVTVIVLSFAQKQYDHSFSNRGVLGFLGYVSLVGKITYAFSVLWDGLYVSVHYVTEQPRPIATGAMFIIALQQTVHLLHKYATRELVRGHAWPIALLDTVEWAQSLEAIRYLRRR